MEDILRFAFLYDFYGVLLTEKQRLFYEMHYLNDFSLSEIAEQFSISPQGVRDLLRRTEVNLEDYEAKLHLIEKHLYIQKKAEELNTCITELYEDKFMPNADQKLKIDTIKALLKEITGI